MSNNIIFLSLLFFSLYFFSLSFFKENNSQVISLNSSTFEKEVIQSNELWLILFYSPSSEKCKEFSSEFKKTAIASKGIFKLGAINSETDKELIKKYNIINYPTLKFFGLDKKNPIIYNGEKKINSIIEFMFNNAKEIVNKRINEKKKKKETKIEEGEVVVLDDDNFEDVILNRDELWMVAFYAPWCPHCKQLLPNWDKSAWDLRYNKDIKFAKIDATVNKKYAEDVKGFPTIKAFYGKSGNKKVEIYQGERDSMWIEKYAEDLFEKKSEEL